VKAASVKAAPPPPKREGRDEPEAQARKLTWKQARELESLEKTIAGLETQKAALGRQVNAVGGDYERLNELAEELKSVESELERARARWLELSELEN
jgi:ATP-binding cassette subfamily F protein uup